MARSGSGTTTLAQVALWLSIVGALNWGLVGFFDWDLVRAIFGHETATPSSGLARAIYAIVGLSGVALAILAPRLRAASQLRARDAATIGRHVEARP